MQPLNNAGHWAWRAVLSALAGGGLTAAGLGGPVGGALGATAPASPVSTDGSTAPAAPGSEAAAPEAGAVQPSTTTSTIAAPPPPSPTTSEAPTEAKPKSEAPAPPATTQAPTVVLQRKQRSTPSKRENRRQTATTSKPKGTPNGAAKTNPAGPNNVALSPQLLAAQSSALASALASSAASVQALGFYRIPLFLLPIYKAAAVQYGVPWQILAAINEIETNYGTDQSVSTAGAIGWMQFMPATWLQYGVDALDAGYADPYNPVDAIFAAARYLRAAGAANDLHGAILAYNHSEEYVASVLLRAKLISSYPKSVIATLTGLTDGRVPVAGKQLAWGATLSTVSTATANAAAVPGGATAGASGAAAASSAAPSAQPGTPGSSASLAPTAAAAAAKTSPQQPLQLVELTSAPNAAVVAVQDGRIIELGHSRRLGSYLVLRDVYGDVFTYAGLGSFAPTYTVAKPPSSRVKFPAVEGASTRDPAPSQPASAGRQPPVTLKVKTAVHEGTAGAAASGGGHASGQGGATEGVTAGAGKVRLFAHPGNPDAVAAAASTSRPARRSSAGDRVPLRRGSIVATGTILGHVRVPYGAKAGHLRFAIRPAGDSGTIDPRPILANWAQLDAALHPQGARAENALLGATASDVLLMSKAQLERTVLSDPGVVIDACGRHEVASGKIDARVLAMLAFLSRSGLKPTVSALGCSHGRSVALSSRSAQTAANAVDISAINGVAIAGHQGTGTITDLTIRTLLTLPAEFVPHAITSLMRYPSAPNTHAVAAFSSHVRLAFQPGRPAVSLTPTAAASSARSARRAPSPLLTPTYVSSNDWERLLTRIAALPAPSVAGKPSSSAIPDPKRP
jgi:soluble lytic murein transglycosylase-like protein